MARIQRVQKVQKVQRGRYRPAGDEYEICVAYYPYRLPLVILSDSEGSRYLQHMRQKLLNTVLQKEPLHNVILWAFSFILARAVVLHNLINLIPQVIRLGHVAL